MSDGSPNPVIFLGQEWLGVLKNIFTCVFVESWGFFSVFIFGD